ncbi:hypothetical protein BZG20_11890 [Salinivibrio sp. IB868]|uniref:restriction endonuclease subunit S n=1 Tax=unclassified Salinivibrio TaxID=2636825 RepID=UPI00098566BB|nr:MULTISPECIES: restriction endonuclease subunit S [unclassified Salinivibrio]OOE65570.1 hypothetical protein BZG20_11890 [Salinivibrio sp. IB868]OOE74209.1 hypothetical protein BZG22_08715 [Salinivibrio sp. IB870]
MSWPTVPAAELMLKRGGSVNPKNFPDETFELFSIPAYDVDTPEIVAGSEIGSSKNCIEPGDVLVSKIVPHIRRCWVVTDKKEYRQIGSGEWMIFRDKRFDSGFLRHFFTSDIFHYQLMNTVAGVGGSLVRARPAFVEKIQVPLPPLEEQKRIAAILDKADAIRQKRKQAIDLADEFLRSVFLDMFGDPVTNPKGWETKSLKEVSEHINDCPHSTPKWTDAGVICVRTSNLTKGGWNWEDTRYVSDETYNERTKRGKLEQGDIILSREGTVGIAALVPESVEMCMGQRLVQVRANREFVLPEYLLYLLLFELEPKRITRLMAGSTSKHINVRDLKQLKILLPSIDLQKKFVEIMNKSKETTSSMVLFSSESVNSSLALSQKAFSGQL